MRSPKIRTKTAMSVPITLLKSEHSKAVKEIESFQIGKEEIKTLLFIHNMVINIGNLMDFTETLLELVRLQDMR